jgi:FAD/FMN-containing dehydrogenase
LEPDWDALQEAIAGNVVLPGSPDYESVRKPFATRFHAVHPQAVLLCSAPNDVAMTLSLAVRAGLHTATRSGGHCFADHSSTDGIVIDVTPLNAVSVAGDIATIGAGARLGDVYRSLSEHDLTIAAGSCPSAGIAGLTLGGGLGILGRKHGVTSDHLLGAQVVLADGRIVDCDEEHHGELFWALRGAGAGSFGVVTSLVFRTIPATSATNFHLTWAYRHAAAVIEAWQLWGPTAPDELYASLLLRADAEPGRPPVVDLFGSMLGGKHDTAELLDDPRRQRRCGPGIGVSRAHVRPRDHTILGSSRRCRRRRGRRTAGGRIALSEVGVFRRPLPPETVAALLAKLTERRLPGHYRGLDFTLWGGAYNRTREDATAFVHRHELFSLKQTAIADSDYFPTQTSRTGGTPITARTTNGWCESREPTIRMTSFVSASRFRAGSIDTVDRRADLQRCRGSCSVGPSPRRRLTCRPSGSKNAAIPEARIATARLNE